MPTQQKADISGLRETTRSTEHYRRETSLAREIAVLDPSTGRAIVIARTYYPGATAYCCLWVWPGNGKAGGRGYGKAGGGGYHKQSAALGEAIRDAGIRLAQPINGVGDDAMNLACEAIARAVTGKRRLIVHVAHG